VRIPKNIMIVLGLAVLLGVGLIGGTAGARADDDAAEDAADAAVIDSGWLARNPEHLTRWLTRHPDRLARWLRNHPPSLPPPAASGDWPSWARTVADRIRSNGLPADPPPTFTGDWAAFAAAVEAWLGTPAPAIPSPPSTEPATGASGGNATGAGGSTATAPADGTSGAGAPGAPGGDQASPSPVTSGAAPSSGGGALTGSINLVDRTWVCNGPVALESVTVTILNVSKDAVYLRSGCTGSIGRIDIVQYRGDGIHLNNGAHDLVIGGGTIRCYAHDPLKHQDGIQVMGGTRVTFRNMDVGCYSANNSQVWINAGAGGNGTPTDIVFEGGRFQGYYANGQYGPGGAYGIAIVNSIRSGARGATICPNAHPRRMLYLSQSAIEPVDVANQRLSQC